MGAINDMLSVVSFYFKKSLLYFGIFLLFTINLIALSISLSCNQDRYFGFSIVYIMFNYLQYRVKIKEETCNLCGNEPFPMGSAL